MASKEDIKKAILEVAGNPESGVVREYADKWAEAIFALDNKTAEKEVRIMNVAEKR